MCALNADQVEATFIFPWSPHQGVREASVEPWVTVAPSLTRGDALSSLLPAAGVNCILSDAERHRGNSLTLSHVLISCCALKRDLGLPGLLAASVQMRRCRAGTRSAQCTAPLRRLPQPFFLEPAIEQDAALLFHPKLADLSRAKWLRWN